MAKSPLTWAPHWLHAGHQPYGRVRTRKRQTGRSTDPLTRRYRRQAGQRDPLTRRIGRTKRKIGEELTTISDMSFWFNGRLGAPTRVRLGLYTAMPVFPMTGRQHAKSGDILRILPVHLEEKVTFVRQFFCGYCC
jgi:hypothetical protein